MTRFSGQVIDLATGWGSANMLQLAWGINWQLIPAYGTPSITFSGPSTGYWYNTNQTVSWTVSDAGSGSYPAPGVAGFMQGWDSIPADPYSEPHGGTGNSFYSGPQYPFATDGCLSFVSGTGCATAGSSQGCHTAQVEAWDNQGVPVTSTFGPVCYDTVAPTIKVTNSPVTPASGWWDTSVTVTLHPTDPGGSNASGIFWTLYAIDSAQCYPGNIGGCYLYQGPITISAQGQHYIYYFTEDNAGNFSAERYEWVSLDLTPPVTTSTLGGNLVSGTYYSNVQVALHAADTGGSGVKTTYYSLDGGGNTVYTGSAFTVSSVGGHTVVYWSVDSAGNVESAHTIAFTNATATAATLTAPAPGSTLTGSSVTFTWTAGTGNTTGYSLWLGSTAGTNNLYHSGATVATSVTATGLPTNGETLYARLFTYINGVTEHTDYTYTAQ